LRFLVDESLAATVARLLVEAGHDALHLGDVGQLGASDEAVMRTAAKAGRVVISEDTDFGELLALGRHPGPSVVLLRRGPHRPQAQARLLLDGLPQLTDDLAEGAIVVISPGRIRIRRLPADPNA
jgi:predicted nuclease of predicted toxin-antitoxin system